jgi:hypothetical protein
VDCFEDCEWTREFHDGPVYAPEVGTWITSKSIGLKLPLFKSSAEQAVIPTTKGSRATSVSLAPASERGGSTRKAPSSANWTFMKTLKLEVIARSFTPSGAKDLARFSKQLGWWPRWW